MAKKMGLIHMKQTEMKIFIRFRNVLEQLCQHKHVLMNVGDRNFNYISSGKPLV